MGAWSRICQRAKKPEPLFLDPIYPFLSPPAGHLFTLSFTHVYFSLIHSFLHVPGQASPLLFGAASMA